MIDDTCTMPVDESELYPGCAVTRAVSKKAERELPNDETYVQDGIDGDITLS